MNLVNRPITEAVILAGGMGTRLRSEVPELPKPMAPVAGRPFLEYLLDFLYGHNLKKVILSVGYKHQFIVQHFGNSYRGMIIDYAIEVEPLGTGGALQLAKDKTRGDSPIVVMNGDTWFPVDLAKMATFHQEKNSAVTIAVHSLSNPGRYTDIKLDANKRVVKFIDKIHGDNPWINGGVYIISPNVICQWCTVSTKPSALEYDLIPLSINNGAAVYGFSGDCPFVDIGIPEDYRRAKTVMSVS